MSSINCKKPLWALVDCNNFYASCEKLFRPDLADRPVVVLSNNDGCIVSRSAEAKALGIPMGAPEFKIRPLLKELDVAVFSSNYALYGDISTRILAMLEQHCPVVEPYSIDEAFLRLDAPLRANLPQFSRALRATILRWTGISVSIGLAETRTLAKVANHVAKNRTAYDGVFSLVRPEADIDAVLAGTPVDEVWGVGRGQAKRLRAEGVRTALDLKRAGDLWLRKRLTVAGWRTALELRGLPCIGEGNAPAPRKALMSSRSFANKVRERAMLAQALSCFAARAGARLRREGLVAGGMAVHIRTSRHESARFYDQTVQLRFPAPTADSLSLINAAMSGLERIYRPGFGYTKAGVMLFDLEAEDRLQGSLLVPENAERRQRRERLMASLDAINRRFGRDAVAFGAQGLGEAPWHMRRKHCSPRLTTDWKELPLARC